MHLRVLQVGPLRANCYLLGCERTGEALVVDPGGDAEAILAEMERLSLQPSLIILTHYHFDHILAAPALRGSTGAPLALPAAEATFFEDPPAFMRAALPDGALPSMRADRLLRHGDLLHAGDVTVQVIETPGHSPGGLSLYAADEGLVITGDALFREGIGRCDLPGGDAALLDRSIRERLFTLPDETIVYPGHGPASTIGHEKRHNPWLR